ncbi:AraC family transcriptional regulator [Hymenobacter sp. GOD-10R]|uniref:helix-turn-helix transcriptional regulator n=1 Tax=Hymenobacter sp. GOD-10R TaxID=3093922 RepID=UPI002D771296|nr:AraC family transcriptional regulator [Hymenobacter sp. GOD-10R]WRQ31287.1 AraC family transcriptional regulator [Hymenobacter sp. GOD-10R]
MTFSGNVNTLRYDDRAPKTPQSFHPAFTEASPRQTSLLGEQRWPQLAVQLFAEPACIELTNLLPPSQLRLMLLLSGTTNMQVRSNGHTLSYISRPGTVKLTTPHHQPYEMQWAALTPAPIRTAHLYLPPTLLARTAETAGLNPARVEVAEGCNIPDPLLYQLSYTLAQEVAATPGPESLFAESATQLLAAQLLRRHCAFSHVLPDRRGKLTPAQLQRVRDYVQAHLGVVIRLENLAELVFLSSYHFCRVFKRTTGLTPNQFLINERMVRATELLRNSDLSVKQVAATVGYSSHAHFTQLYARHTGQLPVSITRQRPA